MKIKNISIKDVAGIKDLHLDFDERMNILCGPNGIGKTTVLECCAHSFSLGGTPVLKSRSGIPGSDGILGVVKTGLKDGDMLSAIKFEVKHNNPSMSSEPTGNYQKAEYIIPLKTNRLFEYQSLDSVKKDNIKDIGALIRDVKNGILLSDIKGWFVNRDLYSNKSAAMSIEQLANFELAKRCFSMLNEDFMFSHVEANSLDIFVKTPSGSIVYEYLSSGFKSCFVMLLGIIKELELRFKHQKVENIEAIVLIDEIELHLHPDWQGKICGILTKVFPNIQFIVTTHSAHVIQSAERSQIIALESKDGFVKQRQLPETPYGFKGWTVDEVLTDVMGMSDTRTEFFNSRISEFEHAIDSDDFAGALAVYNELNSALHPNNPLRKVLKLQLAGVGGGRND